MRGHESAVRKVAVPFLKWAGGKSLIADKIIGHLGRVPPNATYFEGFLGGGAVFLRLRPKRAVLMDSNEVLIRTWNVVKTEVNKLIAKLEEMAPPLDNRDYEKRRETFNELISQNAGMTRSDDIEMAAHMIWINHTCYNGLFRVNKEGKFNVPYGRYKNPFIYNTMNLRLASSLLKTVDAELITGDYSRILDLAKDGDVIYFDPPYHPTDKTSNFTEYTSEGFGLHDQTKLADIVYRLVNKHCRPVVSNSATREIVDLYSGLEREIVQVPRAINCVGSRRGRVPELIIYPKSRFTLHEQWDKVIKSLNWNLDGREIYQIPSSQVKLLTGKEPRLVAKMDTREDLPEIFSSRGYFVLPVAANKYALVPGDGYHDLENIDLPPSDFIPKREIPISIALKSGESAAIQTALYSGLLEQFIGTSRLRPTLHNDKLSLKNTSIRYGNNWNLTVDGARVEVDAGFENHEEFYIFECKNWYRRQLRNFNIRQLFFPYLRAVSDLNSSDRDWKIRCFFLNVEPDTGIYRFWEYKFLGLNDYSGMDFVKHTSYKISQRRHSKAESLLQNLTQLPTVNTNYIPQADDAMKLIALLQGVAEGFETAEQISKRFRFVIRQSNYYGEAAEEMGLIERARGGKFILTSEGQEIARLQTDMAANELIKHIFTIPVFHEIAETVVRNKTNVLDNDTILPITRKFSQGRYNETTLLRRTQTITSWLNWIGETTGLVRVRKGSTIKNLKTLDSF